MTRKPIKRLTRKGLEEVRIRVTLACLITAVENGVKKPPVRHLWFAEDNINAYALRDGNPPSDTDRPFHMKGLQLAIDLGEIPAEVRDQVRRQRKKARSATDEPTRMIDVISDPRMIKLIEKNKHRGLLAQG